VATTSVVAAVGREIALEKRAGSLNTSRASAIVVTKNQPGSARVLRRRFRSDRSDGNGVCWESSAYTSSPGRSSSSVTHQVTPVGFGLGGAAQRMIANPHMRDAA